MVLELHRRFHSIHRSVVLRALFLEDQRTLFKFQEKVPEKASDVKSAAISL